MTNAPSTIAAPSGPGTKTGRRPFGLLAIIVIQVLMMLGSGLLLAVLAVVFFFTNRVIQIDGVNPPSFNWQLSPVDVAQLVLIFVVNAVCAVGLWRRQRWAWFLTMLQLGVFMISDLYSYFTNSPPETYAWSMLLNVLMVFYLNQRDVQAILWDKNEGEAATVNDLQLLRVYEPVVKYTEGELFFPMAIEPYIAAASLWQMDPHKRRSELVPAGQLTVERLSMHSELPAGHTLYLRFQSKPLGALAYRHWRARSDRPILYAAGRLTRVGIASRVVSSLFNFSLLLRGSVPGGTAAAADIGVRHIRSGDPRYVYYGRVLRQGGYVILHYVFFFAMNDWRSSFHGINDHEADWEQCVVYLVEGANQQLAPRWVAFASHDYSGDDLRRRWDDPELTLVDGCHPVIYAGAGSHASYCLCGEYITGVEPKFLRPLRKLSVALRKLWVEKLAQGNSANVQEEVSEYFRIAFVDYARGDGVAIGPGQPNAWTPILMDDLLWVQAYRGLWGVDTEDPFGGERAPAGPKYNRDGSVRLSWYDPLAWAGLDKVPPPLEAPLVLAQRLQQLETERAAAETVLAEKRLQVRELELQTNALLGNEYWQPVFKSQVNELGKAQSELQAQSARVQSLAETQQACRQLLEKFEQDDWGDPQAHLRHQHRPELPMPKQSRLLDLWGAVSGALLMAVLLLLLIYAPANWYAWIVVAVLISLGVESWLRGRLAKYLLNVTIFLAFVTVAVLLVAFWRIALVLAIVVLAIVMTRDNLRELRHG